MKATKKDILLIAISVGIIVCVGIIMAIVGQNKASATESICTTCGGTNIEYISIGEGKHKYECQDCLTILDEEDCTWGVFSSNGNNNLHTRKCEKCQAEDSHEEDFSGVYLSYGEGIFHSKKCKGDSECLEILMHQPDWSNNDGICAYNGTDGTCGIHCTHDGETTGTCEICGEVLSDVGQTCEHTLGWSSDNGNGTHTGTCTKCEEEVTENHIIDESKYEKTETTHAKKKQCLRCAYMVTETAEAHNITSGLPNFDGTHTGICTVCGERITENCKFYSEFIDITVTKHTEVVRCSVCNLEQIKNPQLHHYIDGTCVCGARPTDECTNHQITTGTDNGDGTHTGTCPNCNKQITEEHNFENGECTKCRAAQNEQTCTNHQITTGTDNGDGTHTGTCPTCNKQITETHNYVNGTCVCGATQGGSEACEHDFEMKYNDTMHWEQCKKCNEVKNNKKHSFINGKCSVCEYECKHTDTTIKKNNTYHWTECNECGKELNKEQHSYTNGKCSCGKTEETEECTHKTKEWKYNTNQHWQECKDCGAEIEGTKESHSYTNGKCKCGKVSASGEEEGCTHTNREWKSNTTEHWQVCKDCGQEIDGTRAKHVNVDGKCKNCGLQEGSTSGTKIPNTGNKTMIITLPLVLALVTFGAIKMKKYKEI